MKFARTYFILSSTHIAPAHACMMCQRDGLSECDLASQARELTGGGGGLADFGGGLAVTEEAAEAPGGVGGLDFVGGLGGVESCMCAKNVSMTATFLSRHPDDTCSQQLCTKGVRQSDKCTAMCSLVAYKQSPRICTVPSMRLSEHFSATQETTHRWRRRARLWRRAWGH